MKTFLLFAFLASASAFACPADHYVVERIALDANGVLTRSEVRPVQMSKRCARKHRKSGEAPKWENVVVDRIALGENDEISLNAAPDMQDASVQLVVRIQSQSRDAKGVFSTTYAVREIWTSSWGGQSKSEKRSHVTVKSNYLGEGKHADSCGSVEILELKPPTYGMEASL